MPRLDFITFVIIMLMGLALQVTDNQVGSKDIKPKFQIVKNIVQLSKVVTYVVSKNFAL